jgi:hypothetical protein
MSSELPDPIEVLNDTIVSANQDDVSLPDIPLSSTCFGLSKLNRFAFQFYVFASVYRMVTYINKLYQDGHTACDYFNERDMYFSIISAACIVSPPFIYAVYLVGKSSSSSLPC